MRLIDADKLEYFRCADNKCDSAYDVKCQTCEYAVIYKHNIDNAPTEPQPDFKDGYRQAIRDGKTNFSRPKGEWKVIGRNVPNNIWHVFCPKCNCDMFTEFTSYCPNCGEPKKEINIAELNMRGEEDVT